MSAEGSAHETSFLARPLAGATAWIVRHPWLTLACGCLLAAASALLTATRLGFHTSRLDLLNPKSSYNRLWLDYVAEFGDEDDSVVVFQAADSKKMLAAIDDLAAQTAREKRYFHSVFHRVDLTKLRAKGLYYLTPQQLTAMRGFVDELAPVIAGQWSSLKPGNLVLQAAAQYREAAAGGAETVQIARQRLLGVLGSMAHALDGTDYQSPWPPMPQAAAAGVDSALTSDAPRYLLAENGRLGFVLLRLRDQEGASQFDRGSRSIDELRKIIKQTAASHPGVRIGLTGLPIMENDEMRESATSMWQADALSLVGVSLVVIACFGGMRHPLLAAVAFLLALAWSFGYTTLVVGHLNILSAAFGAILIGIGMDFGIHYVARYAAFRNDGLDCEAALVESARCVGPGIVTGGITTAIAFFTVALTDFTGVVELGIISGGGVLLCIVAAMLILPAMVKLVDRRREFVHVPQPLPVDRWLAPLGNWPGAVFLASLAATAAIAVGCWQLRYDHNLLHLQPAGMESVAIEEQLLSTSDQSLWYAVTLCQNREELLKKKQQFSKMPSVERVDEIVSLIPSDLEAKRPLIAEIDRRLADLPLQLPVLPIDSPAEFDRALQQCAGMLAADRSGGAVLQWVDQLRTQLRVLSEREASLRLGEFQQHSAGELLGRLQALRASANPQPPGVAELPPALVERFVGRTGKHQLRIYGRGNLWDMASLERFVQDVKRVDPQVTGKPLQTYYASRQMQQSYIHAACYALIAITIAIILDFGNLRDSLLALLPMALGVVIMFGLMGLFDIPLNAANMIVLPLLLGIGLDTGVHMVHDYRAQSGRYRISASTAVSVLITALTTIVGFGALMIASHRGLQSLGRVMTIGATACLATSLITLPALLTWLSRNRGLAAAEDEHAAHLRAASHTTEEPRIPLAVPRPLGATAGLSSSAYLRTSFGSSRGEVCEQ
jgi:hopanoid biosynthesis associated RND transporter like protein HpnN